jgi:heat shock protein beta
VKKYSEFINYPIKLYLSKDVKETVEDTDAKPEESKDSETKIEDEEEKPKEEKKTKEISKTIWEWDLVNEIKAIWMRSKDEITEREYNDFYKTITKSSDDPAGYSHFSAEGEIDFKALLYLP